MLGSTCFDAEGDPNRKWFQQCMQNLSGHTGSRVSAAKARRVDRSGHADEGDEPAGWTTSRPCKRRPAKVESPWGPASPELPYAFA
jgi:hypothetical protein